MQFHRSILQALYGPEEQEARDDIRRGMLDG
jgi:hypothetical protein